MINRTSSFVPRAPASLPPLLALGGALDRRWQLWVQCRQWLAPRGSSGSLRRLSPVGSGVGWGRVEWGRVEAELRRKS